MKTNRFYEKKRNGYLMLEVVFFLLTVISISSIVIPKLIFEAKLDNLTYTTNYLTENTIKAINNFKLKDEKYDGTKDSITSNNVIDYTPPNFENKGEIGDYYTFSVANKKALLFGFLAQTVNKFNFKIDYSKYCSDKNECRRIGKMLSFTITKYCLNSEYNIDTSDAEKGNIIVKNCQI